MGYPKGRPKKFSYSLITELYRDGKNTMEISRQIGVHHSTVRYALHRRGIDTSYKARMERTRQRRAVALAEARIAKQNRVEQMRFMYTERYMSMRQIAVALDMDRRSVYRDLIFAGVKLRGAVCPDRAVVIAREKARKAYLAEQRKARKEADDLRVERMMAIIDRRPMRLAL